MEFLLVNLIYTLVIILFGAISLHLKEGNAKQFFCLIFFFLIFILLIFIKIYSIPSLFSFPFEQRNFIILFICTLIISAISSYLCMEANLDGFIFKNSIKVFAFLINILLVFQCQMSYFPFLHDTGKLFIRALFNIILGN